MTSTMPDDRNEERRRRVLLGPLPAGFLRTDVANDDADHQTAVALQQQYCGVNGPQHGYPAVTPRLSITIAQAKLSKNYGITRMDPYVRVRVGHCIYETHTDPSGGRTPRWNKVVHCLLPVGVTTIYLEIFDECSFTMDELIAWAHITVPSSVFHGETVDNWFTLNGKQGDGKEGAINLVLSYSVGPASVAAFPPMLVVPSTGVGYAAMPMYAAPPQPLPPQQPPPITAEQLQQIEEMFPSMDKEVIRSVLEANGRNKDATINSLLQMSE
ncbi:toll-interacting protein B-like [Trichoplusia ni]|uniref:Toll-interacting protein B-like n=1 Tax=Trichoplusia ni TaxID=7111 RepID=A0A7E5W7H5_TRINI|nr:toll-interacting protein B-like [Trichoplusia ni]